MLSKLPTEIQEKIQHYFYELNVSEKKQHFKTVHHELLYGWWYTEHPNKVYHIENQYCEEPTILTTLSIDEIYKLYTSENVEWKPFLFYTIVTDNAPIIEYDMEYCFAERLPRLISLTSETI
jgi:hypothetical protein